MSPNDANAAHWGGATLPCPRPGSAASVTSFAMGSEAYTPAALRWTAWMQPPTASRQPVPTVVPTVAPSALVAEISAMGDLLTAAARSSEATAEAHGAYLEQERRAAVEIERIAALLARF